MKHSILLIISLFAYPMISPLAEASTPEPYNVLLIISDDLTATALGCYGNDVCRTPQYRQTGSEGIGLFAGVLPSHHLRTIPSINVVRILPSRDQSHWLHKRPQRGWP